MQSVRMHVRSYQISCLLACESGEIHIAGWRSLVARWIHNPEVAVFESCPCNELSQVSCPEKQQ